MYVCVCASVLCVCVQVSAGLSVWYARGVDLVKWLYCSGTESRRPGGNDGWRGHADKERLDARKLSPRESRGFFLEITHQVRFKFVSKRTCPMVCQNYLVISNVRVPWIKSRIPSKNHNPSRI